MSKTLEEAPVTTRAARSRLDAGLHWRAIDPDVHLGYRKGVRAGSWTVRWRAGKGYKQHPLGTADDAFDGDGVHVLSFHQAATAARTHVAQARATALVEAAGPVLLVADAVEEYVSERERREAAQKGRTTGLKRDTRSRLTKYVLADEIARRPLHLLNETDLSGWRDRLPGTFKATTTRRLVNDFRACLNAAARRHRARLPDALQVAIKNAFASSEPIATEARLQILSDADVRRIIQAAQTVDQADEWSGDLARLVLVLAATGARFSQVVRLRVADVQAADGRLMIPVSAKGKGAKAATRIGLRVGDDVITALRPATAGRRGTDWLLERWRHKQVKPTKWERVSRGPWTSAAELVRPWSEIRTRAELPADVVPYALRHSSIVRGLRAGLPVRLVAALHDTSTAMIEKHYAAYIVDALDELAARAVIPLTTAPATVVPLNKPSAS